jgi:cytochrome c553
MNRILSILSASLALVLVVGCQGAPAPAPAQPSQTPLERGEHLTLVLGCHDCHTPKNMGANGPEPDMSRRLIGHPEGSNLPAPPVLPPGPWAVMCTMDSTAWTGPWGISYATNLTPDQDTGIGIWTEEMFIRAMRTGKHMGEASSRPILPPMPWPTFSHLSDEDLKAVFAYLRSLPATKNHVPDAVIAPPPDAPPPPGSEAPAKPSGS